MVTEELLDVAYEGRKIVRLTVSCGKYRISVLNLGAILEDVVVPDRSGDARSVVWKMDDPLKNMTSPHYGQVIGRYANRIARGTFELDGTTYHMDRNNHGNSLHSGQSNWGIHMWNVLPYEEDGDRVTLCYDSPDGDGGMPGNVFATVTYRMAEDGALSLTYTARSDKDTIVNLTNHTYFNLSGGGTILDDEVWLASPSYLEVDADLIPTGRIVPVAGGPFDFRTAKPIRRDMAATGINGYDHCFTIEPANRWPAPFGSLYDPKSGIVMEMRTTLPAVQFYTGNGLTGADSGMGAKRNEGVCFETEFHPDGPHHPAFPSCVLHAGETMRSVTEYRFGTR